MMRLAIFVVLLAAAAVGQVPATFRPTTFRARTFYGDPAMRPHRWAMDEVRRAHGMSSWQVWPFSFDLVCPSGQNYGHVELDLCLTHGEIRILESRLLREDFICGLPIPLPTPPPPK